MKCNHYIIYNCFFGVCMYVCIYKYIYIYIPIYTNTNNELLGIHYIAELTQFETGKKASSCIAQYSVIRTTQCLHFTPSSVEHLLGAAYILWYIGINAQTLLVCKYPPLSVLILHASRG